jgi:hypothetical protein
VQSVPGKEESRVISRIGLFVFPGKNLLEKVDTKEIGISPVSRFQLPRNCIFDIVK